MGNTSARFFELKKGKCMSKQVEFYFDVGSPAAYLAWTQLPRLCEETGATLVYKPMLLGAVFKATGNSAPATVPAKGQWMVQDLARHAEYYGVPWVFNPHFPINTLLLMRAAVVVLNSEPERMKAYLEAVFRAIWVEQKNMNDPQVAAEVLSQAGFDPQALVAKCEEDATKAALREITEEAVQRGVFGAPTCFVGGEMHFGQDRLEFVRRALEK